MKKIALLITSLALLNLITITPAHAQVSCNDSNYHIQNYVDIKTPSTGDPAQPPVIRLWGNTRDTGVQVVISKGGSTLSTININNASGNTKWDERTVAYGDTLRYTFWIQDGSGNRITDPDPPGWMPANVGSNAGTCGTGCDNLNGGNYAVVNVASLYTAVNAGDNGEPYNLNISGYTLFLNNQRTQDTIDTSMTCWNDAAGYMKDFNDFQAVWTVESTEPPIVTTPVVTTPIVTTPVVTTPIVTTPIPSVTITATPTHTPEETGFAEEVMVYAGVVLYVLGVGAFMGAKGISKKRKISL